MFYGALLMYYLIVCQKFNDAMSLHGSHLPSKCNQWGRYWEEKYTKGNNDLKLVKKLQRIDRRDCYILKEAMDSFIQTKH